MPLENSRAFLKSKTCKIYNNKLLLTNNSDELINETFKSQCKK